MKKNYNKKKVLYKAQATFLCEVYVGPPGCGKTTRIASLVKSAVSSGLNPMLCSLTRTAAAEMAGRDMGLPKENIGTLHAHALRALGDTVLVEKHLDYWNELHPHYALGGGPDGVDPYSRQLASGPAMAAKLDLLRAKCVPAELWPMDVASFARQWSAWKSDNNFLDFTDLIERAVSLRTRIPHGCDSIFVDEAQDLSKLEQQLLHHWAKQCVRLVIVGDPFQALFCWRGAEPKMFDSPAIKPENRHVLSQSFRVPKTVHAAATKLISQLSDYRPIEYRPTGDEGSVTQVDYGASFPTPIVQHAARETAQGHTVMVLASCGYFLNPLIEELRQTGTPFSNPWRTKNGRWNPLQVGRGVSMGQRVHAFLIPIEGVSLSETPDDGDILDNRRMNPEFQGPRNWTVPELKGWCGALSGVLVRGARKQIEGLGKTYANQADLGNAVVTHNDLDNWFEFESAEILHKIMDGMFQRTEAIAWYGSKLASNRKRPAQFAMTIARSRGTKQLQESPKLFIGTIHSFKGAEADTVFLIPDLSASGHREWMGIPQQRDSIVRMFYVAMTRARQHLILCKASTTRAANIWEVAE